VKIDYPESLKKLHEIREQLYEETKELTPAERGEMTNKEGRDDAIWRNSIVGTTFGISP
jgi:hypothetical protein